MDGISFVNIDLISQKSFIFKDYSLVFFVKLELAYYFYSKIKKKIVF